MKKILIIVTILVLAGSVDARKIPADSLNQHLFSLYLTTYTDFISDFGALQKVLSGGDLTNSIRFSMLAGEISYAITHLIAYSMIWSNGCHDEIVVCYGIERCLARFRFVISMLRINLPSCKNHHLANQGNDFKKAVQQLLSDMRQSIPDECEEYVESMSKSWYEGK